MACFHPNHGWQDPSGKFYKSPSRGAVPLTVPCGRCSGCHSEYSRQWAVRCMHETRLHDVSCFVTLTYDVDNCPRELVYSDFQAFMRRLRKRHRRLGKIRFFMSGEYGTRTRRPHFHALLFGIWFNDSELVQERGGNRLYSSKTLSECWGLGFALFGAVSFESAAYVSGYVSKKSQAKADYDRLDLATGEVFNQRREFCRMSLKPGIGAGFYDRFRSSIYPHDRVIVNGRKARPPRYYDKLLERDDPALLESLKEKRREGLDLAESHPRRLSARETVHKARLATKQRSL